jgi:hypothetical protein
MSEFDDFVRAVDDAIDRGEIRLVFWTCPDRTHRMVTWRTVDGQDVPRCDECGTEGAP